MRRFLWSWAMILAFVVPCIGQVSTEGTDFWLGFMQNADGGQPSSLEIFITANEPATGSIVRMKDGASQPFTVTPGTTFRHVVSNEINNSFAASGSGQIDNLGIHIVATSKVSVYAFNKRNLSADATVVLPTPTLGQEYVVASYFENSGQNNIESEFLIVATQNNTTVQIVPSVTTLDGKQAGVPYDVTLNQGQTYQVQALADLTGTSIVSNSNDPSECKNFAVFGGNKWTRIGNCGGANDQLYEQLYPISSWGKNFTLIPFKGRNSNGDLYRVITSEPNTQITITPENGAASVNTLPGAGDFVSGNVASPTSISSDRPIQVIQYSKSQCAELNLNGNSPGDPFMLVISPNEQLLKQVTFNTLNSTVINNYYTTVITKTATRNDVTLNGAPVAAANWMDLTSNPEFSYARLDLNGNRDYTLTAPDGFISYVYGFGVIESFGYAAGASLENLNLQIEGDDEQIGIIASEGCLNSEVTFDVLFETPPGQDPIYNTFEWDFGDGNTGVGRTLVHTYEEPGTYLIELTASNGQGACASSETIIRQLEILDIEFEEVVGPISVCPDVRNIEYSIEGDDENSYEWFVSGGQFASSSLGKSVEINWGPANDDAWVKLLVKNRIGCAADTIHVDVKINKRLEPANPTGPNEVCFTDFASVTYSTSATNGSEYEWFVTNGTILGANTNPTVDIQWNGVGTGQVWYREFNPSISDCEGFSDRMDVTIYPEIVVTETITDALCNGDLSGSIDLSITGGKPGYTASWSNGLEGLQINGLLAGTYRVTVEDAIGCPIDLEYVVGEPEILEVAGHTILDVRCFQESNGEVTFDVQGGTAPYSYLVTGDETNLASTNPHFTGLIAGNYTVEITDANNCMTTSEFVVNEPALLEPDLETLINVPICPQAEDGEIFIDAKGGTPAYQFFWNTTPQQTGSTVVGLAQGTYTVTIIDANGCEAELNVDVEERFPRVFIPSAFSPNLDGENDEFVAVTDCNLNYNMKVFNKWGTIVFNTNDVNTGWNGTMNGKDVPAGLYSYKVFYTGSINNIPFEETIKGTVRLFR